MSDSVNNAMQKIALIAAAGTGGHIFPGLAIAEGLLKKGWTVIWLGTKTGMENQIVPKNRIKFISIEFNGIRGNGFSAWLNMPFRLLNAILESRKILLNLKPDVVIGFGGYVSLPVGLAAKLTQINLMIHEQNSIAGLSNKALSYFTNRKFTTFPAVLKNATVSGNPLRTEFTNIDIPEVRFKNRKGPLRILIIGGSLGAKFLNETVPIAINMIPKEMRPILIHQSGISQYAYLQSRYEELNVDATIVPFIENTALAFSEADLIICRSGASTVSELTAVGAAAILVPLPSAVDDHQTRNAQYLVENNAAWMQPQKSLNSEKLTSLILKMNRKMLLETAIESRKLQITDAVDRIITVCEELKA